jgi:hypothetical protein
LLQTRSLREPGVRVEGFDYRRMAAFECAPEDVPDYLEKEYGVKFENALNIGKILRDDIRFQDSRSNVGIQVADLLASGIRRCLRGRFRSNEEVAAAIGRLTLQNEKGKWPVHLVSFSNEADADDTASKVVQIMARKSRRLLTRANLR